MIFLDEVEKRSENGWIDGPEERSDYWKRGDVIRVRELLRGHLGPHGKEINAVLVGLDKETKRERTKKKRRKKLLERMSNDTSDNRSEIDERSVGSFKILGWVQKKQKHTNEDVEWRYARNAEGDEDDTTVDMTDALVQEHPPSAKIQHDRFTGKVPLEILTVKYVHVR